ncbi:imidazole glycerol phosphate synthase subunit HisH [Fulvivirga sp. M361]|uniref:imidazole glycerol phosphate synthase subunit HisH n=1 Tax=Fulvivirga sp. M361 TaxID=2594266 RepID=UPI00117B3F98|nr:imidazole glycerol phosphate synthase subunit HisH [Fulvivirga sp. M361]TRX50220.1 imidazole glycerol phosphate synthase subunit HisH [Fulvivirga sp. M361]
MITIIDYKAGNILSIRNMLKKLGVASEIAETQKQLGAAKKLILPGVGHFDHGMKHLRDAGMVDVIRDKVIEEKIPILGICLGAQLLGKGSEEGIEPGLSLVDMDVVKFDTNKLDQHLKIPHMGWSNLTIKKVENPLFIDSQAEPRFYFVHSYHFKMNKKEDVLSTSYHGYFFTSAFHKDNIYGVQFHPEKSHKYGMKLLENFAKLN